MIYPPATQRPGPVSKQGYPGLAFNACRGVVCHSMVGSYAGALGELDNLTRRASWHFSITKAGLVFQHYDTKAVTWHCGSKRENGLRIGIEHEGGLNPFSEPLTIVQRNASVALVRWLSQSHGFPLVRKVSLWEHNELAPPSDATACPSNRIPWSYYIEEEDMAERVWCAETFQTWIVGKGGSWPITDPNEDKQLTAIYGGHTKTMTAADLERIKVKP